VVPCCQRWCAYVETVDYHNHHRLPAFSQPNRRTRSHHSTADIIVVLLVQLCSSYARFGSWLASTARVQRRKLQDYKVPHEVVDESGRGVGLNFPKAKSEDHDSRALLAEALRENDSVIP
jgi:hypothetical protein